MPVNLKFYDQIGQTAIEYANGIDLGRLYKGKSLIQGFTLKNEGDSSAVNVKLSLVGSDEQSLTWKSLSFDKTSEIWHSTLEIDEIKSGKFMSGWAVYSSDFNTDTDFGTWLPTNDASYWEFYTQSGWVHHLKSTEAGRLLANDFPASESCVVDIRLSVQNDSWSGVQLKADEAGYGYFVLINADEFWINTYNDRYAQLPGFEPIGANGEAVVQIWTGKLMQWSLLHMFPISTGMRGDFDNLTVELNDFTFRVWYKSSARSDEQATFLGEWKDNTKEFNRAGKLAVVGGPNGVTRIDQIEYKMKTNMGAIFMQNIVGGDATPGEHDCYIKVEYDE